METPKLFIGLDVHKQTWAADIRTDLFHHKHFNLPADPPQLAAYVGKNFPDHEVHLTYEAGCCGFSMARYFLNLAWHVTVVNPWDVPKSDKQNYQKTDKLDAKNLAKQLSTNNLKAIYIATEQEDFVRCLVRQRNHVVKQIRQVKSRIKAFLLFMGQPIPLEYDNANWSKEFIAWLSQQFKTQDLGSATVTFQLHVLAVFHQEYLGIGNQLRS